MGDTGHRRDSHSHQEAILGGESAMLLPNGEHHTAHPLLYTFCINATLAGHVCPFTAAASYHCNSPATAPITNILSYPTPILLISPQLPCPAIDATSNPCYAIYTPDPGNALQICRAHVLARYGTHNIHPTAGPHSAAPDVCARSAAGRRHSQPYSRVAPHRRGLAVSVRPDRKLSFCR